MNNEQKQKPKYFRKKNFVARKLGLNQADGFHAFIKIESACEYSTFLERFQSMKSAISTANRIQFWFFAVCSGSDWQTCFCLQSTLPIFLTIFFSGFTTTFSHCDIHSAVLFVLSMGFNWMCYGLLRLSLGK